MSGLGWAVLVVVFVSIAVGREMLVKKENFAFLRREFPIKNSQRKELDDNADWDMATLRVDDTSFLFFSRCDEHSIELFSGAGKPSHKLQVPLSAIALDFDVEHEKWWQLVSSNISRAGVRTRILVRGETKRKASARIRLLSQQESTGLTESPPLDDC